MKDKKPISWEVLDKYKTLKGLVTFLRKRKIKGLRNNFSQCPLAVATGWRISAHVRFTANVPAIPLTDAQQSFVFNFDLGSYPDLERK